MMNRPVGSPQLPSGTVTFLFTDIEGSTQLWEKHSAAMKVALARHDAILRDAIEANGGAIFKMVGDAVCAAFSIAPNALAAAMAAQRALNAEPWGDIGTLQVRIAVHSDMAEASGGDYIGAPVNRVARLLAAASGGQVLFSASSYELSRDHLPAGAEFRALGEHHLKDLQRPDRIFQLVISDLQSDFLPLRTLLNRPNNLSLPLAPLIGRGREVAAIIQLLREEEVRVLALTGPGGTGKTRLSLQVAAEMLGDFEHGVFFIALALFDDPALVASSIAQTLHVKEVAGKSLSASLKNFFSDKTILLVLDNFEQVVSAAPLLGELVAAAPGLKVLVTSRIALRIYGEREFPVQPLVLPDLGHLPPIDALAQYPAVALFIKRAQQVHPNFILTEANASAVAEVCARLDGLPLAIELAAARIKIFSPPTMLARMVGAEGQAPLAVLTGGARDLPARQQTLRSMMDWSYRLLDDGEQKLFVRLSVFVNGFSIDAAEAIVGESLATADRLQALVENSLLRQEESTEDSRLVMLQTLREYAVGRLKETPDADEVFRRYAEYFLEMAESSEPQMRGPQQKIWIEKLEKEHDNLRAAMQILLERGQVEMTLRLGGALWRFWAARGYLSEGRRWLESALEKANASAVSPSVRARALEGVGVLYINQGNYHRATNFLELCLTLFRETGDQQGVARALNSLGGIAQDQGRFEEAKQFIEASLASWRELKSQWGIAGALNNLGLVVLKQNDFERAEMIFKENLSIRRQLGDQRGMAFALTNLGVVALYQNDFARAIPLHEESLALFRQLGNRRGIAAALTNLGRAALGQGAIDRAMELQKESLTLFRELDDQEGIAECLQGLAGAAGTLSKKENVLVAAERAARLFGAAERLRGEIGSPLPPTEHRDYEAHVESVRHLLDEHAFQSAFERGRAMTMEQAIEYALDENSQLPINQTPKSN